MLRSLFKLLRQRCNRIQAKFLLIAIDSPQNYIPTLYTLTRAAKTNFNLVAFGLAICSINSWGQTTTTNDTLTLVGQQPYVIQNHNSETITLSPYLSQYHGDINRASLSELLNFHSTQWQRLTSNRLTNKDFFSPTQSLYRIALENHSELAKNILILAHPSSTISLDFYTTVDSSEHKKTLSLERPSGDVPLNTLLTAAKRGIQGRPEIRIEVPPVTTIVAALLITNAPLTNSSTLTLQSIAHINTQISDNNRILLVLLSIVAGIILVNVFVLYEDEKTKLVPLIIYSSLRLLTIPSISILIYGLTSKKLEYLPQLNFAATVISAISLLTLFWFVLISIPSSKIKTDIGKKIKVRLIFLLAVTGLFIIISMLWASPITLAYLAALLFLISLAAPIIALPYHYIVNKKTLPSIFAIAALLPAGFLSWAALLPVYSNVISIHFEIIFAVTLFLEIIIVNLAITKLTLRLKENNNLHLINSIREEQRIAALSPILKSSRHDLRAPISDIIGLSELVLDSHTDQQQRSHLFEIQNASRQALEAINKIFSMQHNDHLNKNPVEPFELASLLADCTQHYGLHLQSPHQEIIISIQVNTPEHWSGDHEKIRQLTMHAISLFSADHRLPILYIEVKAINNNRQLQFLFSMEASTKKSNNSSRPTVERRLIQEDFSAKLVPLKSVVSALKGKLSTTVGHASFNLTIDIPASPLETYSEQFRNIDLLKNKRVIVIDDNPRCCDVITNHLKQWSIQAFSSNSFEDATAQIRHQTNIGQSIDLALIDYIMPSLNGIEVTRRFRSDPGIPNNLSIVLMSNASQLIDSVMTKNYGVHRVLDKPVLSSTLQLVLLEEFHLSESLRHHEPLNAILTSTKPESKVTAEPNTTNEFKPAEHLKNIEPQQSGLRVLLVEDNPISAKITSALLTKLDVPHDIANCCEQARLLIKVNNYQLALLDYKLPDGTSDQLAQELMSKDTIKRKSKAHDSNNINLPPILIVTLTAYDEDDEQLKYSRDLFHETISKPLTIMQLETLLARCRQ